MHIVCRSFDGYTLTYLFSAKCDAVGSHHVDNNCVAATLILYGQIICVRCTPPFLINSTTQQTRLECMCGTQMATWRNSKKHTHSHTSNNIGSAFADSPSSLGQNTNRSRCSRGQRSRSSSPRLVRTTPSAATFVWCAVRGLSWSRCTRVFN